jgi:sporulation protein YqfC
MRTVRSKKAKRKHSNNGLSEKVERVLELPLGSISSAVRIELMGNKKAVISGCHGIVEYNDDLVRMQTGSGMIRFTGRMLSISCLTEDSAIVEGNILSLEYLS